MIRNILVIDDDLALLQLLQRSLAREGYSVFAGRSGKEGLKSYREEQVDAVILDINLPDASGIEVLKKIIKLNPEAVVIMITAYGEVATAVESMKAGAYDYVTKPFQFDELALVLAGAAKMLRMRDEINILKRAGPRLPYNKIIGVSEPMEKVMRMVAKVSQSPDTTVLIMGESGTGKELVANAIHYQSPRRDQPLVTVCCTVLKEQLLESELFGHEKGAFTDAKYQKKGLFEVAAGGTIFLDEIGDMQPALQGKLLRVLEGHAFRRLGSNRDIAVDVRILAATNKNLAEEVKQGNFRDDLYFRLRIVPIEIPPLRERKDDILPLAGFFIEEFNRQFNRKVKGVAPSAQKLLLEYPWPGNARELKNMIERIFILETGEEISREHLPPEIIRGRIEKDLSAALPSGSLAGGFKQARQAAIENLERNYLRAMLDAEGGNVSQSARAAGMTRSNFQRLMKKYRIERRENRP